jgi:hypothetical protein
MPGQPPVDLTACTAREYVTFSGGGANYTDNSGAVFFQPTNPPFSALWGPAMPQPTLLSIGQMTGGAATDVHHAPAYDLSSFSRPFGPATYTANQVYEFHCSLCMGDGVYEHLGGPYQIVESIESVFGTQVGPWQFRITKDGDTSVTYLGD